MINIIYISDSNKHFDCAIKEYEKRLGKKIKFTKIKPNKTGSKEQIIQKDTEKINQIISKYKNSLNILLSLKGNQLDSIEFAKLLEKNLNKGKQINFIIGGAYGLDESKLNNISYKLSLSKMTLPHSLALLVLIEQIYRAFQIISGKQYNY